MRLVLDTDVVVTGLRSANGASRLVLAGMAEGAFTALVTFATVIELEDVLLRPETMAATGFGPEDTVAFVDAYVALAERVVVRHRYRPTIQDPGDEMFVEALLNGGGDAIVSCNRRDYLPADHRLASRGETVVPVLSPGETLRRLTWRPAATTLSGFRRP